jgi:hypothetical protein
MDSRDCPRALAPSPRRKRCRAALCVPCVRVRPCVPCVLEVTQTHIHTHRFTHTNHNLNLQSFVIRHHSATWRVTRGGGKEYGSCVRENDGCRDRKVPHTNPT